MVSCTATVLSLNQTIPHRLTVAAVAYLRSCTSKTMRMFGSSARRAAQSVALSLAPRSQRPRFLRFDLLFVVLRKPWGFFPVCFFDVEGDDEIHSREADGGLAAREASPSRKRGGREQSPHH